MFEGMKTDFPGARGYLNTASMGLPPGSAVNELRAAIDSWQGGKANAPEYDRCVNEARALFAALVKTTPECVAVGSQVSAMVGMVAAGLPSDSQVVCPEEEFTSVLFPFLARSDLNVRLVPLEDLEASIRSDIDLVAFSLVQSADGHVSDGKAIARAAQRSGALTLVDATQAAGWLPFDANDFDVTVTGAYKWLASPRGTAFMTVRKESMDVPALIHPGWYAGESPWDSVYGPPLRLAENARRFDLSPSWLSWVGTAAALKFISELGIEPIHEHNVELANMFRSELGLSGSDSAIVALDLPSTADEALLQSISSSVRAGRLRVSFHFYNQPEDVELLVNALAPPS